GRWHRCHRPVVFRPWLVCVPSPPSLPASASLNPPTGTVDRASGEARLRALLDWGDWQRRVLEEIATGAGLRDVLSSVVRFLEAQCPAVAGAVHLVDDDGVTLRMAAGPSLRPEFYDGMDEIVVGPRSATVGAAAHRGALVV